MATLGESFGTQPGQIHAALAAGIDMLGQTEMVQFQPYIRRILPADGYAFWINAAIVSQEELALNGLASAAPISVEGSLHYSSFGRQVEDETITVRRVDFTSITEIQAFVGLSDNVIYVGQWQTSLGQFGFTFGRSLSFYQQANIFHYEGDAIYPVFEAQMINDPTELDTRQVVSNSLPAWLAMFQDPPFPITTAAVQPPAFPIYPSHLVRYNTIPPYASVDISDTKAIQSFPNVGYRLAHSQLCEERVKLVFFGLRNEDALNFQDYMIQYTELTERFGILNMPVIMDDKRAQVELAAIAQMKSMDVEISYNQHQMRDLARSFIRTVKRSITPTSPHFGSIPPPPIVIQPPVTV